MVKKKAGREMNPADAFRKVQRAREIARNKKERKFLREAHGKREDPEYLRQELEEVLAAEEEGRMNQTLRLRKRALQSAYDQAIKRQKEEQMRAKGLIPPKQDSSTLFPGTALPAVPVPPPPPVPGVPLPKPPPLPAGPAPGQQSLPLPPPPGIPPRPLPPPPGPPPNVNDERVEQNGASTSGASHIPLPPPPGPPPGVLAPALPPPGVPPPVLLVGIPPPPGLPPRMQIPLPPPPGPPVGYSAPLATAALQQDGSKVAKKDVQATITGAATAVKRPLAQNDKSITSMVPASVRVRREQTQKLIPAKPKMVDASFGLAPVQTSLLPRPQPVSTGPSDVDSKYQDFLKEMGDLGAFET